MRLVRELKTEGRYSKNQSDGRAERVYRAHVEPAIALCRRKLVWNL